MLYKLEIGEMVGAHNDVVTYRVPFVRTPDWNSASCFHHLPPSFPFPSLANLRHQSHQDFIR